MSLPARATGGCAGATPAKWEKPLGRRLLFVHTDTRTLVESIAQKEFNRVYQMATPAPAAALLAFDHVPGAEIL